MRVKYAIIFILIILSISLTGCFLFPQRDITAEWTVMVYLDADNNLESAGIDDINEMEMVGSSDDVNIVVQVDRIPYSVLAANNQGYIDDASNGDWTTTRRYYITQDSDSSQISSQLISDLGEQNMGDPETLVDFANWTVTNYPANHYLLVIWNHGGGFRSLSLSKDIAWDYTDGEDKITMPELESALSSIDTQIGGKIDVVGMDACLMAMVEVAYQIKDYADILVASEENVPTAGWPYDTIFDQLVSDPYMSSEELASEIVTNYISNYTSSAVVKSAIDLNYMDTLAAQLSNLASSIMGDSLTSRAQYILASTKVQYYGDYDFIDLYDFCNKLLIYSNNSEVKNRALIIQQTLINYCIIDSKYSKEEDSDSHGLSIYFPYYYYDDYYENTDFSQNTFWNEMLLYLGF
ncbi:MAG: clostripain-related cysteine peptidase [Atribacterota bacterium]|nr:clostripain-related cysteine peptidase [Atribacterota bacterium]